MIDYIGDISSADAKLLATIAAHSPRILEFGCGASTQVITWSAPDADITSVDTEPRWIDKTKENLMRLDILPQRVHFRDYKSFAPSGQYDFIFVDGWNGYRLPFAVRTWQFLKVGGQMAFHDTRRANDFGYVLELMRKFQNEIGFVNCNANGSNITIIGKKQLEKYSNWNLDECRPAWKIGSL